MLNNKLLEILFFLLEEESTPVLNFPLLYDFKSRAKGHKIETTFFLRDS